MSKKMKVLVMSSILLNVLLLGIIIGNISHRLSIEKFDRRHAPELAVKLSPDKEALFFETMEKVRKDSRDIQEQIEEARESALSILTAPEFDEAGYQVEVNRLHELRGIMMQRLADATKELAQNFNQEERRGLAEHLKRPPHPPDEQGLPHKEGPPPPLPHEQRLPRHGEHPPPPL